MQFTDTIIHSTGVVIHVACILSVPICVDATHQAIAITCQLTQLRRYQIRKDCMKTIMSGGGRSISSGGI